MHELVLYAEGISTANNVNSWSSKVMLALLAAIFTTMICVHNYIEHYIVCVHAIAINMQITAVYSIRAYFHELNNTSTNMLQRLKCKWNQTMSLVRPWLGQCIDEEGRGGPNSQKRFTMGKVKTPSWEFGPMGLPRFCPVCAWTELKFWAIYFEYIDTLLLAQQNFVCLIKLYFCVQ